MTSRAIAAAVFAAVVSNAPLCAAAQPGALPEPDLSGLEEGVQERLGDALSALESTLAAASIEGVELGRTYGQTGRVFHAHHVFEVALACYAEATDLDPENPLWPYLLGFLHLEPGRFGEAESSFLRVLEIDPTRTPIGAVAVPVFHSPDHPLVCHDFSSCLWCCGGHD